MPGEFSRDVFLSYNNDAREIPSSPMEERESEPRPCLNPFSPLGEKVRMRGMPYDK